MFLVIPNTNKFHVIISSKILPNIFLLLHMNTCLHDLRQLTVLNLKPLNKFCFLIRITTQTKRNNLSPLDMLEAGEVVRSKQIGYLEASKIHDVTTGTLARYFN